MSTIISKYVVRSFHSAYGKLIPSDAFLRFSHPFSRAATSTPPGIVPTAPDGAASSPSKQTSLLSHETFLLSLPVRR